MKYFNKLDGRRIYLSPVNVEDVDIFLKWMNGPTAKNLAVAHKIFTKQEELDYLTKTKMLAIILKETDTMIGTIEFMNVNQKDRTASLGINIGEETARRKGYGTEAIKLFLDFGFQIMNLHTILLTVYTFNEPAIKCYEKLGFQVVGTQKEVYYHNGEYHDRVMMEMIDKEWREINE